MAVKLHWFLPTTGDSRSDLSHGDAVGAAPGRGRRAGQRRADLAYLGQVARAAEQSGFEAALTPISSWCPDPWVLTAALTPAHRAAEVPRRVPPVVPVADAGGADGRDLPADLRRPAAAEHRRRRRRRRAAPLRRLPVQGRALRAGRRVPRGLPLGVGAARRDFAGEHVRVEGAHVPDAPRAAADLPRRLVAGGARGRRAARRRVPDLGRAAGAGRREARARARGGRPRRPRAALRDPPARHHARHRRRGVGGGRPAARRPGPGGDRSARRPSSRASQSEGQRRMVALHGGRTDQLEVSPNLWAGVGLVRGGAGTALVGSHEEVADRIAEYHELGIDEFVLSGYPHLEEAYRAGEGLLPGAAPPRPARRRRPSRGAAASRPRRERAPVRAGRRRVSGNPRAGSRTAAFARAPAEAVAAELGAPDVALRRPRRADGLDRTRRARRCARDRRRRRQPDVQGDVHRPAEEPARRVPAAALDGVSRSRSWSTPARRTAWPPTCTCGRCCSSSARRARRRRSCRRARPRGPGRAARGVARAGGVGAARARRTAVADVRAARGLTPPRRASARRGRWRRQGRNGMTSCESLRAFARSTPSRSGRRCGSPDSTRSRTGPQSFFRAQPRGGPRAAGPSTHRIVVDGLGGRDTAVRAAPSAT